MIRRVLAARALRAFADGFIAVLLPAYLLALGLGQLEVGLISTATLLGSAFATLAVGAWGHRFAPRALLRGAALLMAATGAGFAGLSSFWPLLVVAFVGTLNPSSGDVSVFLPLEHARLAEAARGEARTALFARYSVLGALCAAVDAFAGGLIVNALLSLWLLQRFGLSLAQAGAFFFWAGLLSALSQFAAPLVAQRIGLLNTMVFTHIPANICLILAALAPSLPVA